VTFQIRESLERSVFIPQASFHCRGRGTIELTGFANRGRIFRFTQEIRSGTVTRNRGNPMWGKLVLGVVPVPSSFENIVRVLKLRPEDYASARELREWARQNKNHKYVPSDLLAVWGFKAESEV
jgi:hypothetical protein